MVGWMKTRIMIGGKGRGGEAPLRGENPTVALEASLSIYCHLAKTGA